LPELQCNSVRFGSSHEFRYTATNDRGDLFVRVEGRQRLKRGSALRGRCHEVYHTRQGFVVGSCPANEALDKSANKRNGWIDACLENRNQYFRQQWSLFYRGRCFGQRNRISFGGIDSLIEKMDQFRDAASG